MKNYYMLADGQAVDLEVNTAIAELLAEFAREDSNARRKERWRKAISIEYLKEEKGWELVDESINIEADYIAHEEKESLFAAIQELSEKQRRLIWLYYYAEKTECEIAKLLGVSQQAVNQQLVTVRKTLQKNFEKLL